MKAIFRHLILILCLFVLFACANTTSEINTLTIVDPNIIISELDDEFNVIIEDASQISNIYGITLSIDGNIIFEHYFNNSSNTSKHNVYSVTKSITSLLVGIAIDKGYIDNVDQGIGEFIDLSSYDNYELLESITIRHLLTMTAGLVWDSGNLSSEMINLRSSTDPLGLILDRDLGSNPGSVFNYSDGAAHLISVILNEATGMSAFDFAKEYLFEPLEIEDAEWHTDRLGYNIGGCDLFLSNLDMIKIGQLILDNGVFNDTQIVSENWITQATTNQNAQISTQGYGFYYWLSSYEGYTYISARGWGGQQIYIVPQLNLVITSVCNGWVSDSLAYSQYGQIEDIVVNRLIPLIIEYNS